MPDNRTRHGRSRGPRRCPQCNQPVAWWRNANYEDRWLRVDLSSDDGGTVQKIVTGTGDDRTVYGRVLSGAALADVVSTGELLFTLHSTTCSARRPHNPRPPGLEIPQTTTP